ncbi:MAG TPA: FAD-binding protein [Candidatus Dormibacteraeota bacterium]|nr:FAD-binding protein [Candidatus Dormibacteraeota bacterium]
MNATSYETIETDVLVLGAGGAGLRGAIAAADAGARVVVVCKSLLGKAHTVMAEGGVAAAMHNVAYQDTWEVHFADTIKGGKFINDWRMAELHAKESPERVLELERWGAVFDRTWQGRIHQRPFGAHTYPRLAHIGDRTGLELIRTLQDRAVHTSGVDVNMEVTVFKLLKSEVGRIAGALAYRRSDGSLILYRCAAVLLATGGAGKMYRVTSNSWECTGDGTALAYDAGAQLRDMEMVQFHPTGMVWPSGVRGILVTEGVRGEGGVLRNNGGERFMERYDPERMELSSRDVVARAINSEVLAGRGSPHGGAYLDITHRKPEFIKSKLPSMYEQFLKLAKVDITKQPMEVAPTIHYAMGGVRVEAETGATTVAGLYAAGEVASGLHGANRLGGNSLSDLLVFGKRAGDAAGLVAKADPKAAQANIDLAEVDQAIAELTAPFSRPAGENPYQLQAEIQEVMSVHAPIVRDAPGLKAGLEKILDLAARSRTCGTGGTNSRAFNPGWHTAHDLHSMLVNAEALLRCALERKESRGAHARSDHPDTNDQLTSINYVVERTPDGMQVRTERRPPMPEYLAEAVRRSYARYTPEEME